MSVKLTCLLAAIFKTAMIDLLAITSDKFGGDFHG